MELVVYARWCGIALEILLLFRAYRTKLRSATLVLFTSIVLFVLIQSFFA